MQRRDLAEIFSHQYPRLVAELTAVAGSRQIAEDAANEAFTRLVARWQRISRYDQPGAWTRRVAYRLVVDELRRQRRSRPWDAGEDDRQVPEHVGAHDVWQAVAGLPLTQRQVLVLHVAHDLTDEQIAEELSIPVGTVKSRLSRARARLHDQLRNVAP